MWRLWPKLVALFGKKIWGVFWRLLAKKGRFMIQNYYTLCWPQIRISQLSQHSATQLVFWLLIWCRCLFWFSWRKTNFSKWGLEKWFKFCPVNQNCMMVFCGISMVATLIGLGFKILRKCWWRRHVKFEVIKCKILLFNFILIY